MILNPPINEWADEYQKKNGHVPLIIGREYGYNGDWYRLTEAYESNVNCTVSNRYDHSFRCGVEELEWKPDSRLSD